MAVASPNDTLQQGLSFEIKIGGKALPKDLIPMSIKIRMEVNKIAKASVAIIGGNSYENTFEESEKDIFAPGKEIEISIGYGEKNTKVFTGVIVKHKLRISEGYLSYASRSLVVLEASDKAVKMTLGKKSDIYEAKKDSDILNTIISGAGLTKKVGTTDVEHAFLCRHECSDWEFLINRSTANGMIVLNSQNKITVETPSVSGTAIAKIIYGKDTYSFEGELDSISQLQSLETLAYDIFNEKEIKQSSSEPSNLDKPGSINGKTLGKVSAPDKSSKHRLVPIDTVELKAIADAELTLSRLKRLKGEMTFRGMPSINLGSLLTLEGFGKLFNGLVYVTGVEHLVENGEYVTKASFGLQDLPNVERLSPLNYLPTISGLHVGIVKKIDEDPDKKNRIQVLIPTLKNSGKGIWANLSHFYANNNAGSFFVPELNSEVILGFINDDPRFPVVLGSLYSKNNKPKEKMTKDNYIKSIVTKAGIRLEFEDKEKVFTVLTPGKNKLVISDKDKGLKLEDQNGNIIQTSDKGISITSKKKITISTSDKIAISGNKGIDITSSTGDVSQEGKNLNSKAKSKLNINASAGADIKSSGVVNIKGSMVNIN
jgi:phage protein D